MSQHSEYITQQHQLDDALAFCEGYELIGLDTEFVRTDTFYSNPGLVQIAAGHRIFLIDPTVNMNWDGLKAILLTTRVKKVMHAIGEDIDLFHHWLNITPVHIFDTQTAAGLLGIGQSLGFANLCQTLLGVQLDKSETRSDWTARPLSDEQMNYAANDVAYLMQLYPKLHNELIAQSLNGIVEEECARIIEGICAPSDPAMYYLKLRGAWKLPVSKQRKIQSLCSWREETAMAENRPRTRILPDKMVQPVVESNPGTVAELFTVKGLAPRLIKTYGAQIVQRLKDEDSNQAFQRIMPPLTPQQQTLHKALKKSIRSAAQQHGLPVEMLSNNKVLEELVSVSCKQNNLFVPDFYAGWRWSRVGTGITTLVAEFNSTQNQDNDSEATVS